MIKDQVCFLNLARPEPILQRDPNAVITRAIKKTSKFIRFWIGNLRGAWSRARQHRNFIRERWVGVGDGRLEGRVCVFVHFDRKGEIHDYVFHYLQALRLAGFSILFVSNAPTLRADHLKRVLDLSAIVIRRDNAGYDFGGYKDGIASIPDLEAVELLLLANDSVYGPFSSLAAIIDKTRRLPAQFWGLTDCWDVAYHLQSYFLLFGAQSIRHESFKKFWQSVRYANSKSYIIRNYEVGLTQQLTRAGLRGAALYNSREISHAVSVAVRNGALNGDALSAEEKNYLSMVYLALQQGLPLNLSHYLWDYLIVKMGYPFLKRELLQKNPVSIPHIARWQDVISTVSDFDNDLIIRHLEVSLKNRLI